MRRLFQATLLLLILLSPVVAESAQYTVLHSFSTVDNAINPFGTLVVDGPILYGTTSSQGTFFKLNTDGTNFQRLKTFTPSNVTGDFPTGALVQIGASIYGTALFGGSGGTGVAFKINTDATGFQVIHPFNSAIASPASGLTSDGSSLFGTSGFNTSDKGSVYRMNPDGSGFTSLKDFPNGTGPLSVPRLNESVLYGTTYAGGSNNKGIIYKLNTDGTDFTVLHDFAGGPNDGGNGWYGAMQLVGSTLYGTTLFGGASNNGTLFKIDTDGSNFEVLHSFAGGPNDGASPRAGLTLLGSTLYGMSTVGGSSNVGSIYSIALDGSNYQLIHSFNGANGSRPETGLVAQGNTLYGVTNTGGAKNGGVVFSLVVPEPSAWLLGAIGLAGFAMTAYRRRRPAAA